MLSLLVGALRLGELLFSGLTLERPTAASMSSLDASDAMTSDPTEELRDEEESERERHDRIYAEQRLEGVAALVPSDWERFDGPGGSHNAYYTSVRWLGDLTGKRVLDMGCGTGALSVILAKRGATRVDAFDISGEAVAAAEARAELNGCGEKCRFRCGSCYDIPFEDEAYDVVAGQAILHHLRHKEVAAKELHRVMKPAAKAVLYEPLGNSPTFERFRARLPIWSDTDDPNHWMDKLTLDQLDAFKPYFDVRWQEFELIQGLSRYLPILAGPLSSVDAFLLQTIPALRRLARGIVVEFTRRPRT